MWKDLACPPVTPTPKALRTVKTCVGSSGAASARRTATQMGRIWSALWRMVAPHKVKFAVSAARNCAESGIRTSA